MINIKSYLLYGFILVFLALIVSTGYGAQQITLLAVRHGSYDEEQKTRVAFDFSGGLPPISQDYNYELNEVRILFQNVQTKKGVLKTLNIRDERVEKVTLKETDFGIEAIIIMKDSYEITRNDYQDKKTVVYFDIKGKKITTLPSSETSQAQHDYGSISGKIFDNLNGKPIHGVKVTIPELKREVISNENGSYVLTEIPTGSVYLEFSSPVYESETRAVVVTGNQEANMNVALNRIEIATSPIPTKKPYPIPSTPESIPSSPSIDLFQNQEALEYFQLGEYHSQSNHFEEAIVAYQKAIEYDPSFSEAYYKLGIALGKLGKAKDGILNLEKALQLDPHNASIYNALGAMYGMLQQYEKAIEQFKKAVDLDPRLSLAYNNLGILYGKIGDHKRAIEVLKLAVQIDPESAEIQGALGVAYAMAGQPQNAVKSLQEAVRIDPTYAKAHFNLGITYLWLGDFLRAKEQYVVLKDLDQKMAQDLLMELEAVEKQ